MDLFAAILALVAPTAPGDELGPLASFGSTPPPRARLIGASTEFGLRLQFDVDGVEVDVEIEPAPARRRPASTSRHFALSYRTGDKSRPVDDRLGKALCDAVAERARRNEEGVVRMLEEAAERARVSDEASVRVREVTVAKLIERAGSARAPYFTVSPYVGCLIGCRFCYAQSKLAVLRSMMGLADVPWGSWVDVRMNAPEVLARELVDLPPRPIKFCPIVSDPYHAVERRYRVTRRCLEVLRSAPPRPVLVLSRAALLAEDAALIGSLPAAWAGASIPTHDDDVRRHFEPRGATVAERLETLRVLRAAGARTFAIVQPILPGSLVALADALAGVVTSARIDVLRGVEGAAAEFADARYAECAEERWQVERAMELAALLTARGVALWPGELPPELDPDAPGTPPETAL